MTEGDYGVFGKSGIANVQGKNYPYYLKKLLNTEVVNCGKCGFTATSYLEYYNNKSYAHYVAISQINDLKGTVTIVDPFNSKVCGGSSSFGGTHTVTYDELLGAIRNNKDSWIIVGG